MAANIEIHPDLVDELKHMAELLDVPLISCANEAIARWLQRDAVGYVRDTFDPPERPKLELVKV